MIEDIQQDATARMNKSIEALKHELAKIRTGRAHTSLLEHVMVDYYGSRVPVNQVGNVNVEDARTLSVTPWEKSMVQVVEKAIMTSDLGLNPVTVGTVIRVPIPPLTEQRRKELVKVVRHEGENVKVAVRNVRRDAMHHLQELLKDKKIAEDQERRAEDHLQKLTDKSVAQIDALLASKEKDLMEV